MIVGGVVVETQLDKVIQAVKAQGRVAKRPVNEGKNLGSGSGGGVMGGLTFAGLGRGDGIWTGR
ncbi:AP-2 complex subunit sigma-1 [Pyrenophora tritici-repentis]|nr:AP-2 complex subunit sigma-1 [Pyrenophora tritici-repentis]KAF7448826.1 AP-2 complex protein [Pyrenophora tritici-repentis]KAI1525846.1 AP-2 complex subunit sigma-1 [Pyrenophora tritici-repentis]KAI1526494.1 AP-2 complex subunit sigma-1 [Pyrenophora tritici-repentis]KAI1533905.1 AP-2 complex subunit sigma-1 [Pyrenophora tritici-repentis]